MSLPKLDVLGTRVARRVLFLFMAGAAVPVVVMAVLSFTAIRGELREQSEARLGRLTSLQTQSILGRLAGFATQTRSTGALIHRAGLASPSGIMAGDASAALPLPPGVDGLVVELDGRRVTVTRGVGPIPELSEEHRTRLEQGREVLLVERSPNPAEPRVLLVTPLDTETSTSGTVWARIVGDSIWGPAVTQAADPTIDDMCVLDAAGEPLYCTSGADSPLARSLARPADRPLNSGQVEIAGQDGAHLAAWRDVYLRAAFGAPAWTVVVSEPVESATNAAGPFVYNLLLVILIGLSAALLVTHILVRRTMEPLRDLTVGTQRLARHDLDARVEVRSKDEFGDLASSFNTMAERLGLQFSQLEARRAIDHAALTTSDHARAVHALLQGIANVVPSGPRALALADPEHPGTASLFLLNGDTGSATPPAMNVQAAVGALPTFEGDAGHLVEREQDVPPVFGPLVAAGCRLPLLMLPLQVRGTSVGAVAVASGSVRPLSTSDARRAQDLADQAAVALEKLRLDQEIASMSWETLRALANAIDAKSAWTKGHSERVTGLSLVMGRALDLSDDEMKVLERGCLLHDIGKIGVPAKVLDFDGVLSTEMRLLMEKHPEAGARILAPIRAFRPIIPIVLYHHERWDGSGYPEGLVGEDAPRLARLVAVADVFDAMVSARPYRPALDAEVVWRHIRDRSGADFDPEMVLALDRVMRGGWRPQESVGGVV